MKRSRDPRRPKNTGSLPSCSVSRASFCCSRAAAEVRQRIGGEQIYPGGGEMAARGIPRGYERLQHSLRSWQYGRARKPGVEGATATFLAQFAAHASGHDACTGFCRGVRTGEPLKSGGARVDANSDWHQMLVRPDDDSSTRPALAAKSRVTAPM